jgi:UDP-N-acetylglucosamine 3-dehydrogenase
MANTAIRIGILGAGAMATAHAAAYATMADVIVVGVFSRDMARARRVAAVCRAEPFSDATALIRNAAMDAVDVCLPSAIHHAFVVPALHEGKHVFCETPLALGLAEAQQMLDAARRADRLLQVGLLMRSLDAYEHVKAATTSGAYGRLLSVATWRLGSYLHPGAPDHKAHYSDPSTELMTFDFDFIRWVMGQPARLSASAVRTDGHVPGEISAVLAYDDGRHATVAASGLMPPGFPFTVGFRVLFESAVFHLQTVFGDGPPQSSFTIFEAQADGKPVALPPRNPYHAELQRFVNCIRGRADPELLDAERAIEALVLSIATQRALEDGQSIEVG